MSTKGEIAKFDQYGMYEIQDQELLETISAGLTVTLTNGNGHWSVNLNCSNVDSLTNGLCIKDRVCTPTVNRLCHNGKCEVIP